MRDKYPLLLPCAPSELDDFLSRPSAETAHAVSRLSGPVLVLGAGGKMGLHLSLMLRKAAEATGVTPKAQLRIVAVSRFTTLRDREAFYAAGIETMACDLSDEKSIAALPDAGTVFFLAGVKFGTASSPELLKKFNVIMPSLVANRFKGARIVAFSTGCVYPFVDVASGGATEECPPRPVGAYAESCLLREEAFSRVADAYGTKIALVRLSYAVEFRYGVLVDIAVNVRENRPVDLGTEHVNLIWQADALNQIIRCSLMAQCPAAPINITGPSIHSVVTLARTFGEMFCAEPKFCGSPEKSAWLNNASMSHRILGVPPTTVETMQAWIAAWLISGGGTWGKPTGFEKRDGNF